MKIFFMSLVLAASTITHADTLLTSDTVYVSQKTAEVLVDTKDYIASVKAFNQRNYEYGLKKARLQLEEKCDGQLQILSVDTVQVNPKLFTVALKININGYCLKN